MMILRGLSAARTGRRLHMPAWCARRRLLAAIAHIDRVMSGKADP